MADSRRTGDRHPLCTCPRRSMFPGVIDRQPDCPGGSIAHPPPLTADQMREIISVLTFTEEEA